MRWSRLTASMVAVLVLAACGGSADEPKLVRVADELAPKKLGVDLALRENTDAGTLSSFANVGDQTLMSDARLWEIRRADRLIGTLQITTLLPAADLHNKKERDAIAQQVIGGTLTRLRVEGTEVFSAESNRKALYVWFGQGLFEIMQVKDVDLQDHYEDLVAGVLRHQSTVKAWKPIIEVRKARRSGS